MKKLKTGRRAKRSFTPEFRADAVRLVVSGKSATQVAKDLDLTETTLREWVRRAEADTSVGSPTVLMTEERAELARLRRENKQLRMEREILLTIHAAKETAAPHERTSEAGRVAA
jgi:transposase